MTDNSSALFDSALNTSSSFILGVSASKDADEERTLKRLNLSKCHENLDLSLRHIAESNVRNKYNIVDECSSFIFIHKQKSDIRKSVLFNLLIIISATSVDFYFDESIIINGIKAIVILVCSCNLIHLIFSYLNLTRKSNAHKSKAKEHYLSQKLQGKEDTVSHPMVTLSGVPQASTTPEKNNSLNIMESSLNSMTHNLNKYSNEKLSQGFELNRFISDFEQSQKNMTVYMSRDSSVQSSPYDFWSSENRKDTSPNSVDVSPLLRTSQYQLASNNISPSRSPWFVFPGHDFNHELNLYNVDSANFINWICNMRSWLAQMVLKRLVEEIEIVNDGLLREGMGSCLVGTVGFDTLVQTANNQIIAHNIPNITFLVPFLKISSNQQYIVQRIRDLSMGSSMSWSSMSCFNWNSGGNYGEKMWESHLPTDSELVMHLFLTYLDKRLPTLPKTPSSQPFSSQYFAKSPKSPVMTNLAIVQVSSSPPHYQLVVNGEMRDVPKGRNNLFSTLVQFIHYVKKKEHGCLGNVDWGKSGINILWTIRNTNL